MEEYKKQGYNLVPDSTGGVKPVFNWESPQGKLRYAKEQMKAAALGLKLSGLREDGSPIWKTPQEMSPGQKLDLSVDSAVSEFFQPLIKSDGSVSPTSFDEFKKAAGAWLIVSPASKAVKNKSMNEILSLGKKYYGAKSSSESLY